MNTVVDLSLPARPAARDVQNTLVSLALPDPYGKLLVRQQFDLHCGLVYFTVEKGARASGTFTVSPYRWGPAAIPTSVMVCYGRGDCDANHLNRTDRPWVNGIELAGGTHWPNRDDWATFHPVNNVHVRTPTGRFSSAHVPDRTQHRVGTIVLALLGCYMSHPLRPVLQLAYAGYIATRRLSGLASSAEHVRSKIAAKEEEITCLEEELDQYARLEVELRELADGFARRAADELAHTVGGAA